MRMCISICVFYVRVQKRKGEKERRYKRHKNMKEDKSFSCFSNILIFHECLFDVVLNIHVFMLSRKREMMQKKCYSLCYTVGNRHSPCIHKQACAHHSHIYTLFHTNETLTMKHGQFSFKDSPVVHNKTHRQSR